MLEHVNLRMGMSLRTSTLEGSLIHLSREYMPFGKTPFQGFVQAVPEKRSSRLLARFRLSLHLGPLVVWERRRVSWCPRPFVSFFHVVHASFLCGFERLAVA